MTDQPLAFAAAASRHIREVVLHQSKRAGVGHIGSALSVADLLACVFATLTASAVDDPDRDRFVLSKGHAALALFAALNFTGVLSDEELSTYCGEGTLLGVHPEVALPGVDFGTGSLGQGLPMGVGAALAARMQGSSRRVAVLISDAECNEGSIWEAAMFAAHHELGNLLVIVDQNEQQALGSTADVSRVEDMAARWRSFGWDAVDLDGHDHSAILTAMIGSSAGAATSPRVLVAHTVFGAGVDFMKGQVKWHYLPMDDAQYDDALAQVVGRR